MPWRQTLGLAAPLLRACRLGLRPAAGSVKVLAYHGIPPSGSAGLHRQLARLDRRYPFITPEAFHAFLDGSLSLRERHLLITFDDGFESSRQAAMEVLEPLGIKALFFLTTGLVDLANGGDWRGFVARRFFARPRRAADIPDWQRPMTWEAVRSLRDRGHHLGAHTVSHGKLSRLRPDAHLLAEIIGAKERLMAMTGMDCQAMALPFGRADAVNAAALAHVARYFRYCYSAVDGVNHRWTNPLVLRRLPVDPMEPPDYVEFRVESGLSWYTWGHLHKLDQLTRAIT